MRISVIAGILAGLTLLAVYAATMTFLAGREAAWEQFLALWYLMVPLVAGFGIQVAAFVRLKQQERRRARTVMATGGAAGTVGMLACCAHHATDALPLLGLSGVSLFLTRYQKPLLLVSLAITLVNIRMMTKQLKGDTS